MEITETLLPGVGIRYEMATAAGRLLGVVVRRDGDVEVCSYAQRDPDQAVERIHLEPDESAALADLLGAPRISQRFADLSREVPGLESARFTITPGSRYDRRTLGDTQARTRTGASVVAVVRGDEVITSPGPEQGLLAGDVVVAIGSREGLGLLDQVLAHRPG